MASAEDLAEEYRQLRAAKKTIEKRLERLKEVLISDIKVGRVTSLAIQERNLTAFDNDRVWQLMDRYGIPHKDFTMKTIAPSLVEQLYWEGRISDDDLRYIRTPKYSYVLVDAEEDEPDLQE